MIRKLFALSCLSITLVATSVDQEVKSQPPQPVYAVIENSNRYLTFGLNTLVNSDQRQFVLYTNGKIYAGDLAKYQNSPTFSLLKAFEKMPGVDFVNLGTYQIDISLNYAYQPSSQNAALENATAIINHWLEQKGLPLMARKEPSVAQEACEGDPPRKTDVRNRKKDSERGSWHPLGAEEAATTSGFWIECKFNQNSTVLHFDGQITPTKASYEIFISDYRDYQHPPGSPMGISVSTWDLNGQNPHPTALAIDLSRIPGIQLMYIDNQSHDLGIEKGAAFSWDEVMPAVLALIKRDKPAVLRVAAPENAAQFHLAELRRQEQISECQSDCGSAMKCEKSGFYVLPANFVFHRHNYNTDISGWYFDYEEGETYAQCRARLSARTK